MKKRNECSYCKRNIMHMVITLVNEDIHVHAPFDNKMLMDMFMDAIKAEMEKKDKKIKEN